MTQGSDSGNVAVRAVAGLAIVAVLTVLLLWLDPQGLYPWIKALHVIAVISWMAGMLYLPRLFVYHAEAQPGSEKSETFKVMERRLLRAIINPAMVVTWVLGLWLAWSGFDFAGGWLHAKILAVLLLSGVHGYLSASVRRFADDRNEKPARHWRIVNEIPTVLMIVIVILVVVKPF
ncbi:protoporphyrinogen oxidase HemJ [Mesorhizobium microcysteis]|uniref:Protoporphyrinogen IX oxidase n=1 Tax=Neoaquamicrobium microcysteis TaxID=2682781 RepID=A0A5D4GTQ3_9HYPH|nr:protoporphyrinogen oxidase HemJ [Mesorhizobium microcysteis]TYR31442.1 protoporphyrinogen oxidase HemJ [Mesorhizobium microcysteis]